MLEKCLKTIATHYDEAVFEAVSPKENFFSHFFEKSCALVSYHQKSSLGIIWTVKKSENFKEINLSKIDDVSTKIQENVKILSLEII